MVTLTIAARLAIRSGCTPARTTISPPAAQPNAPPVDDEDTDTFLTGWANVTEQDSSHDRRGAKARRP
ncbi:MAG: hypothetical protein R3C16_01970 [Hyphomonadaceae bacterium]